MNYVVFNKWVKEKLLRNLPEKSIVVIDNTGYHFSEENPEEIKTMLSEKGHELVRLPLSHQDLNPLELIWRDIKQNHYSGSSFCFLEDLEQHLERVFDEYPQDKWTRSIDNIKKIESDYFEFNGAYEDIDNILLEEEDSNDDGITNSIDEDKEDN